MRSYDLRNNIIAQIDAIAARGYDWGGDHELPIRADVRDMATRLLHDTYGASLSGGLDAPEVGLNPDGTLDIFFEQGERTLVLTIPCEGVVAYAKIGGDSRIEGIIRTDDSDAARRIKHPGVEARVELNALLDWLAGFDRQALL